MTDIDFLLKALELKDEKRTGWELRNIEDPESVADHSWNIALLCLVYSEEEDVNTDKCVKMALVHDLAESQTGDLVTRADSEMQQVDKDDKHSMELEAMQKISSGLENKEIMDVWKEYDNLDEFFATTEPRLNTSTGKQLFKEIKSRYEKANEK